MLCVLCHACIVFCMYVCIYIFGKKEQKKAKISILLIIYIKVRFSINLDQPRQFQKSNKQTFKFISTPHAITENSLNFLQFFFSHKESNIEKRVVVGWWVLLAIMIRAIQASSIHKVYIWSSQHCTCSLKKKSHFFHDGVR